MYTVFKYSVIETNTQVDSKCNLHITTMAFLCQSNTHLAFLLVVLPLDSAPRWHKQIWTSSCTHTHTYTHTRAHTHTHTREHTRAHTHTHTHTHRHTASTNNRRSPQPESLAFSTSSGSHWDLATVLATPHHLHTHHHHHHRHKQSPRNDATNF